MAGAKPAWWPLFGMPPTARAQMLAALCEDTGRSAGGCAGEADATRFAEDTAVWPAGRVFPARDYVLRPVEGQSHEYEYRRLAGWAPRGGHRASRARLWRPANIQRLNREFCGKHSPR